MVPGRTTTKLANGAIVSRTNRVWLVYYRIGRRLDPIGGRPSLSKALLGGRSTGRGRADGERVGAPYRPAFGADDSQAGQPRSVARYGELTVAARGSTAIVNYPSEEQFYMSSMAKASCFTAIRKCP